MMRRPPRSTLSPTRRSPDPQPNVLLITSARNRLCGPPLRDLRDLRDRRIGTEATVGSPGPARLPGNYAGDRKSTRLNSSHGYTPYAVFCLKKTKNNQDPAGK